MKNTDVTKSVDMKYLVGLLISLLLIAMALPAYAEWSIDLSRRTQSIRKEDLTRRQEDSPLDTTRAPAGARSHDGEQEFSSRNTYRSATEMAVEKKNDAGFIERIFDPGEPAQDIVILNTPRGFVPNTIRIRRDARYTVYVVNVNEKEKNVSFILDGFSEHHATYFGKMKSFTLEPKKEGVYSFLSPETAVEGRFVVYSPGPQAPAVRGPAGGNLR